VALLLAAFAAVGYWGYWMAGTNAANNADKGDAKQVRTGDDGSSLRRNVRRPRHERRIRVKKRKTISTEDDVEQIHASDANRRAEAAAARRARLENRENSELISEIADMIQQEFTEEERRYLTTLRDALNSDDNKRIIAVARLAVKSNNSEIKERAINALGWVGEEALPELTEFLMDDDEEIVQAAIDKWEEAIRECENEADVINNTMLGMMAIKDEAACDYLSMNFIKSGEATLAVEAIVNLMACDNEACHRPAKEAYEWITDKEWTGAADAKAWIAAHPDL
jgi:hypothetical protein